MSFLFEPGIQIDLRVLSFLSECLDRIRANSGKVTSGSSDLFSSIADGNVVCRGRDHPNELYAKLDEIRLLKSTRECLSVLTKDLEAVIATRCEQILPSTRQHGMASLPREVLLLVFGQIFDSYDDPFDAARIMVRDLSLVCKHFRDIIISIRELWSFLDLNAVHSETYELFLRRSEGAPLSVRFNYYDPDLAPAIRQALIHKDRWHYLDASFPSEACFVGGGLAMATFPSVRTLRIFVSRDFPGMNDIIFEYWDFPHVKDVELSGGLPESDYFIGDSVKAIKYTLHEHDFIGLDGPLAEISAFLAPQITLQTLDLDLSLISRPDGDWDPLMVELPDLRHFTITNWRWKYSPEGQQFNEPMIPNEVALLVRRIAMPNVENISVTLAFSPLDNLNINNWVLLAFGLRRKLQHVPRFDTLPNVTHFAFKVVWVPPPIEEDHMDEEPVAVTLHEFTEYFPHLQVLSFSAEACKVRFVGSVSGLSYKNLRSLHISYLDEFWERVNETYESGKVEGDALEDVRISSNCLSSCKRFKSLFPNAAVHVTE